MLVPVEIEADTKSEANVLAAYFPADFSACFAAFFAAGRAELDQSVFSPFQPTFDIRVLLATSAALFGMPFHQLVEKLLLYKTIQSTICNIFFKNFFVFLSVGGDVPSLPAQDCTCKGYAATGRIVAGRVMPLTRPTAADIG